MDKKNTKIPSLPRPSNWRVIGTIVIIFIAVVGIIVFISMPSSAVKEPELQLPENISSAYYKNFEHKPKPKAKKKEVVNVKTKPKTEEKPLSVADVFKNIDHTKDNALDLAQKQYAKLANGKNEIKILDGTINNTYVSPQAMTDSDWQAQGLAKSTSSLPVKLDRTITADRFIEAVLVNSIDSTLGGKIVAQINHNVYGASGNKILIPIGSRAIGFYQPINKVGKERLAIAWQRIITPKGVNIMIADATASDGMGKSGITGLVDNRAWDRYGIALLTSSLNAIAIMKVPASNQQQQALINTYGKDLSQLGSKILEETLEIKPRILVNAGQIIHISINSDVWIHKPTRNTAILEKAVHGEKK